MDTRWDTALSEAEAQVCGEPPFRRGDRVLLRRDPQHSWVVDHCEPGPRGYTVHMGVGNVVAIGPSNDIVLAPRDFEDAPAMPSGSAQHGLSEADRQAKIKADADDPLYRADMRLWHRSSIAWLTRWREIVGEEQAELGIAFHRMQLAELVGDRLAAE